jgi:predicted transcriptional regulator
MDNAIADRLGLGINHSYNLPNQLARSRSVVYRAFSSLNICSIVAKHGWLRRYGSPYTLYFEGRSESETC